MKVESKRATVSSSASNSPGANRKHPVVLVAFLLIVILAILFSQSFDSRQVIFSNDGPLGAMMAEHARMPGTMSGVWEDLNWLGNEGLRQSPSLSTVMHLLPPPVFSRLFCPVSLLIVGVCACFCLNRLKLAPVACVLGGLAAGLNSDFFSTSCWGVASQIIGFGANYLALGLLADNRPGRQWLRFVLAGMAVGCGVMEAYDIGAIFSLLIAAYVFYETFIQGEGTAPKRTAQAIIRVAVVAAFAAWIATYTLVSLFNTQLKGIVGTKQDAETREHRWAEATQWSLPKIESLQIIIPGIFGYRLDSPEGDNYWGGIGAAPAIADAAKTLNNPNADQGAIAQAQAVMANPSNWRISGTGFYAGVPVVLIALWAVLQSWRKTGSPFTLPQRRELWFWTGTVAICFLLAFGKYAPFFRLWYSLPYTSVIRNPTKFMHVFNWALVILFAYGVDGLVRTYMQNSANRSGEIFSQFKVWLAKAAPFERRFLLGCFAAVIIAAIGWGIYASQSAGLQKYMEATGIDHVIAPRDVHYSLLAVGLFVSLLALSIILLVLIFSGQFSGTRAKLGGVLLGFFVVADLGSSDSHWIRYWDIAYKYATNPVIDLLREKPWEHRVDMLPFGSHSQQMELFRNIYDIEWHQQLFQYYNIQSLKVVMEPRVTVDKDMFLMALPWNNTSNIMRTWELTSTRYLLGNGADDFVNALNQRFDPGRNRFRIMKFPDGQPARFNLTLKPDYDTNKWLTYMDYTVAPNPNGELGIVEFTGTLPRAKLFSNWQISADDQATLKTLASPEFDPHQLVLISDANVPTPSPTNIGKDAGTVEILPNYRSKRIELVADVKTPSVLLMTERYNPHWQVEVDGKPASLLRCNFITRGIYLEPGKHDIVLRFILPQTTLYISLAAIALGLGLCGWLAVSKK